MWRTNEPTLASGTLVLHIGLRSQRAQASPPPLSKNRKGAQLSQAEPTRPWHVAGGKVAGGGSLLPQTSVFSPGPGDSYRQQFCREGHLRWPALRLCAFASLRLCVVVVRAGSAPPRLCVEFLSDGPPLCLLCVLVSWWLRRCDESASICAICGYSDCNGGDGKLRIKN